jgi:hypothetical protein
MQLRFRKFWDLMHEADRPWHYKAVMHLCTRLEPFSCAAYSAITAATMQSVLAQRAKVGPMPALPARAVSCPTL